MARKSLFYSMIGVILTAPGCAAPDRGQLRASLLETDRQWVEAARKRHLALHARSPRAAAGK